MLYRNNKLQYFPRFKVWWLYDSVEDQWVITDREDYTSCSLMVCEGKCTIDQCINSFIMENNNITNQVLDEISLENKYI